MNAIPPIPTTQLRASIAADNLPSDAALRQTMGDARTSSGLDPLANLYSDGASVRFWEARAMGAAIELGETTDARMRDYLLTIAFNAMSEVRHIRRAALRWNARRAVLLAQMERETV